MVLEQDRPVKQVLVVRKDLNMRKGKIAAQAAHASLKVFLDRKLRTPLSDEIFSFSLTEPMELWLKGSFTKVCLYVKSEDELEAVHKKALKAGIPTVMIVDSGKTEFHGALTKTVVAIGPDYCDKIDPITEGLKLF